MKVRNAKVESNGNDRGFQRLKGDAQQFGPRSIEFVNKFFGILKECGYDLLELAAVGSSPVVAVNPDGTVQWEPVLPNVRDNASSSPIVMLYKTTHSIPGDTSMYLRSEIMYYKAYIYFILSYVDVATAAEIPLKQSARIPIPLMHVEYPYSAAQISIYKMTATDFGGWSIHHQMYDPSYGVDYAYAYFAEPTSSISESISVGYALGLTGMSAAGATLPLGGATVAANTENLLNSLGELVVYDSFENLTRHAMTLSQSYIFLRQSGLTTPASLVNMSFMRSKAGFAVPKLMYYAPSGERVFIPNGPMMVTPEFITPKLRMVTSISSRSIGANERFSVVEPVQNGENAVFEYTTIAMTTLGTVASDNRFGLLLTDKG